MKSVLIFGDSNTWGLIPGSDPAERYPQDVRWAGRLQSRCPDVRFSEDGVCGRTIAHEDAVRPNRNGLVALRTRLKTEPTPDAAIVMLGTNDCKACYTLSAPQIAEDMRALLRVLESYVPANRILLIAPPLLGADVWKSEKDPEFDQNSVRTCRALTEGYRKIAGEHGTAFLAAADHVTVSAVDDEHLDADGHRKLSDAALRRLVEMQIVQPCTVRETEDFYALSVFFRENGLGVLIEKEKPERILKMWRLEDTLTGELLASVTLEKRGGVYALGDIAVKKEHRGKGYGAVLQQTVFREAQRMGIHTLWACAKEPDYYLRCGWQEADWDSSPDIAVYCPNCEKWSIECHPKKLLKHI